MYRKICYKNKNKCIILECCVSYNTGKYLCDPFCSNEFLCIEKYADNK